MTRLTPIFAAASLVEQFFMLLTCISDIDLCQQTCSNLGNLWRRLVLPKRIEAWSLTSLQQRLVKTGGRLIKHSRYCWVLLAEGHPHRRLWPDAAADLGSAGAERIALRLRLQNLEPRGRSVQCPRNRLRGSKRGWSDGQKRTVGTPLISVGLFW